MNDAEFNRLVLQFEVNVGEGNYDLAMSYAARAMKRGDELLGIKLFGEIAESILATVAEGMKYDA